MPLIDLHAHFPMHTKFPPRAAQAPDDPAKALEFWVANHLFNFQAGEPRVSLAHLVEGSPGGIGSVLYDPDDEFFRGPEPRPEAFQNLLAQLANVEAEVQKDGRVRIVRNPAELRACLDSGQRFLFHCVEGALGLGGIPDNVGVLASKGIAYIIIAHLFFRGVATCANAFPFLPEALFDALNPDQDAAVGLTPVGFQIVERTFQERILVDITHCSDKAQQDIFEVASGFPNQPLISSHNGVRGKSNYPLNLSDTALARIASSGGIVGVILFPHWLRQPKDQLLGRDGFDLVFETIDCIAAKTGGFDHVGIGTDLDGFIQPVKGCADYGHTPDLVAAIQHRYGGHAEAILWRNALRVLEAGWQGA